MMNKAITFLFVFTMTFGVTAHVSADEFGDRFYNQAPAGLGDFTAESHEIPDIAMDDMAKDLQDIMPAAGEEGGDATAQDAAE